MVIAKRVEFSASAAPGHGHNYEVEVAIAGTPDPVTGMILDLKRLKEILEDKVLSVYDHRLLSREVAPFDRVAATVENIAVDIWGRVEAAIRESGRARLAWVRVYETADLFAEYRGEE